MHIGNSAIIRASLSSRFSGIYGVIAYAVQQRTHEMGVRIAVGAQPGDVLRMVVQQGLTLGLLGVAIGAVGALAMSRLITSMLYGTGASDAFIYLAVSVVFLMVAMAASYFPARRAARLDAMVALRCE